MFKFEMLYVVLPLLIYAYDATTRISAMFNLYEYVYISMPFACEGQGQFKTFVLRGRRGTYGTGWRAWTGLVAGDAAALCVAGMAHGDIDLRFCVAGVALGHIHLRFAWQLWRLWHCAGSGGELGPVLVAGDVAAPYHL